MVGLLSLTAGASLWPEKVSAGTTVAEAPQIGAAAAPQRQAEEILAPNHVERLGRQLFTRYLLAVEVAGTLLMVALVGAVAIVAHGRQSPEASTPEGHRG